MSRQVWSLWHVWQWPSCLYQTWMPFLEEKVTNAWVLKCGLYPERKPLVVFRVCISMWFSFAASVSASDILRLAVFMALWTVWRVTLSSLAMLASCCPLLFSPHIMRCFEVR